MKPPTFPQWPTEPGVYWARKRGHAQWDYLVMLHGRAPFVQVQVFRGPRFAPVQNMLSWRFLVIGPRIAPPAAVPPETVAAELAHLLDDGPTARHDERS